VIGAKLDVSGLVAKLDGMVKQIKELPDHMGDTMTAWQTDDMHRRYPNTTVQENVVETDVWPTSRLAERTTQRAKRFVRAHKTQSRPTTVRLKGVSHRPVLRPELLEKLKQRVEVDFDKNISWGAD
jgi:hypothetical protein